MLYPDQDPPLSTTPASIVEQVLRTAYGRLVALVAGRTGDLAAAEDALSEAIASALAVWPARGIPDCPEAWLLTAARRHIGHRRRHVAVQDAAETEIIRLTEALGDAALPDPETARATLPDRRLALLFVCAHPAIDPAVRTPLMLQTVLGLDAARIAQAFAVKPSAMGQRLVRAKAKIRDAGVRFAEPDPSQLPQRLPPVLDAIYAAYGTAWDEVPGLCDPGGLAGEALFLAGLLVDLLPSDPEAKGLLALMLYCQARAPARRDAAGRFVPLSLQQTGLWSRDLIARAEQALTLAARAGRFGRYQLEAAIQSLHIQAQRTGRGQPAALVALYDRLAALAPSLGVLVARAAAYGEASGAETGLRQLDQLAAEAGATIDTYQPYWAARAHLLRAAGAETEGVRAAYRRAIALCDEDSVRAHLERVATS